MNPAFSTHVSLLFPQYRCAKRTSIKTYNPLLAQYRYLAVQKMFPLSTLILQCRRVLPNIDGL